MYILIISSHFSMFYLVERWKLQKISTKELSSTRYECFTVSMSVALHNEFIFIKTAIFLIFLLILLSHWINTHINITHGSEECLAPYFSATACYKSYVAEDDYHIVFTVRDVRLTFRNAIPTTMESTWIYYTIGWVWGWLRVCMTCVTLHFLQCLV